MEGRWRIKEFAGRTGVPEATLRAWERRYSLMDPTRSAGGYRLYSAADEQRVVAMQAHMVRGVAAGEAALLALAEEPDADVPREPAELVRALLDAVEAYSAARVDALLRGAFALGVPVAVTDVVLPALRAIGERWAGGSLTVAHEHFASHLFERRLTAEAATFDGAAGRLALLACPPGERHALGLLCFGLALAERGWRVAFLGADMPIGHVADAATDLAPDVVVLSAIDSVRLTDPVAQIRTLAAAHRTLVAGAGATAAAARKLRVDRLELDPVSAAAAL